MKVSILFFTLTLIGVNCVIQLSEETVKKLIHLVELEDEKYSELEKNKKLLKELKNKYLRGRKEDIEKGIDAERYEKVTRNKEQIEREMESLEAKILNEINRLIEINRNNRHQIIKRKNELIKIKNQINNEINNDNKRQIEENNKIINEQILILDEKVRYLLIDIDMIKIIKNQIEIKNKVYNLMFEEDLKDEMEEEEYENLKGMLEGSDLITWYKNFSKNIDYYWNDFSLGDLSKLNSDNERILEQIESTDNKIIKIIESHYQ